MSARAIDALGREVVIARPPVRIVSLVPSETETVAAMVGLDRLVARTEYCEEPRGTIERIATIGGTKNVDVDAVCALAPDLVLANQEENGKKDVEALIARGLPVFVSFPCTVAAALAHLEVTARLLHVDAARVPEIVALRNAIARAEASLPPRPLRVCAPIWKDPWMTFDGRTYASDLLRLAGGENVFADRPRRYPLAADLGHAEAKATERDTRYPRFELEELRERAPELVLLPDEPYRFGETEKKELEALGRHECSPPRGRTVARSADGRSIRGEPISRPPLGQRVELTCGKDLFWYGVRAADALTRLAARLRG